MAPQSPGPAPGPLLPQQTGGMLRGVDRAAFVVALSTRLRARGIPVTVTAMTALTDALEVAPPVGVGSLYWLARLTLVNRQHDLAAFDAVFRAAFVEAVLPVDPHARRGGADLAAAPEQKGALSPVRTGHDGEGAAADLPWHTLPRMAAGEQEDDGLVLPELLPSAMSRIADTPLEELDERELALLGRWLEASAHRWPSRRSRRMQVRSSGGRVALRPTIAASRRTGWEPMELKRYRHTERPLTLTLLCDVSQSMQSYSTAYLHLMRAFARTRRAETFAFSTSLTRLTPALLNSSAPAAMAEASAQVVDRFGGTHLATCLRELLASRHGRGIRGGVLLIASDGWDSDPPEELAEVMARVARRARRVVWLNPRAAAPGYQPLVGSMSAALPWVDAFLPAHTLRELPQVFDAIAGVSSRA